MAPARATCYHDIIRSRDSARPLATEGTLPMTHARRAAAAVAGTSLLALLAVLPFVRAAEPEKPAPEAKPENPASLEWLVPDDSLKQPFEKEVPVQFVARNPDAAAWDKLPGYWNAGTETLAHPVTGEKVTRKVIHVKVPLGLNAAPFVPVENPMTLAKWQLGKRLYFDPILSSNNEVSCASCHDPAKGYTDQRVVSNGIFGKKGGVNAPTVLVSAYNKFQFWDGRVNSLEEQAQGPPGNSSEMFDGNAADAWHAAVQRMRVKPDYVEQFKAAFGHLPTRDAAAKAIATYERTVLAANSVADRAEAFMRARIEEDESTDTTLKPEDVAKALAQAVEKKDAPALEALLLKPDADAATLEAAAGSIARGKGLFFGKANCTACHVGETFTDHDFHNLGVGAKDGDLPLKHIGRFGSLPTGHKRLNLMGAYKTPTVRGVLTTAPYMHDGGEKTLEEVVEFYDRGGNANEYLDSKMRDPVAEAAYRAAQAAGKPYAGPEVVLCGPNKTPIAPRKLNLTAQDKKDLVLYMRALQGDPVDSVVADPERFE